MTRRLVACALCLLAAVAVAVGVAGCGGSGGGYQVRAIFDDANNVITGEQVRIAGVTVGSVGSLSVTPDQKAAVTLDITNSGFQDFRADASCIIRPQSLIGEMYVDCMPTQPRAVGAPLPPPLPTIPKGQPGAGEHLLPVTQTSSPVGIDLVGDVARLPYTQRLSIIINELGAGLAGNGQALEQVVMRANPTLAALDHVLAILAAENRTLANLARNSNLEVAPLAAVRSQFAGFISSSNVVATESAQQRAALQQVLAKLPAFLDELTPTLNDLGDLADQANPALADLADAAPEVNEATKYLTPVAQESTPYLKSLGQAAVVGTPAVKAAEPVVGDLKSLGAASVSFAQGTSQLLESAQKRGALEDILNFIFRASLGTNGYDSLGHYLRSAVLIVSPCFYYQPVLNSSVSLNCNSNFPSGSASSARVSTSATTTAPGEAAALSASVPASSRLHRTSRSTRRAGDATAAVASTGAGGATSAGSSSALLNYLLGN